MLRESTRRFPVIASAATCKRAIMSVFLKLFQ
nr:MAG TPA: hypothetical protein [Caudoviricetes sp.]